MSSDARVIIFNQCITRVLTKAPRRRVQPINTNAEENTLRHKVTMTNAPNVEKKTMTQPAKRKPAAEAVVNAPPMTEGPTERIAWSAREARRRSFVVFVFVFVAVIVVEVGVFSNNDSLSCLVLFFLFLQQR